jgi:ribosomal protein S18 acetylase RimI-like enzyme
VSAPTPRDIEHATIKAWPAAETEARDGWLLLAASGVTGRVNAVWPLDWRGGDVEAAIGDAERWYAARRLPARFKLTDGAYAPNDLPERLAARGYSETMRTLIMSRAFGTPIGAFENVSLSPGMNALFDQALRESTPEPDELEERRSIAARAPAPAAFAARTDGARPLAVGMSAMSGDLAGVFLMRTVPEARRRGHARHILRALLNWAHTNGARHAFLQVDADNAPAITLYEAEGFAKLTTYRFWRKAS